MCPLAFMWLPCTRRRACSITSVAVRFLATTVPSPSRMRLHIAGLGGRQRLHRSEFICPPVDQLVDGQALAGVYRQAPRSRPVRTRCVRTRSRRRSWWGRCGIGLYGPSGAPLRASGHCGSAALPSLCRSVLCQSIAGTKMVQRIGNQRAKLGKIGRY